MLKNILHYAHYLLEQTLKPGEITIDATCGNGNDTLYLADLVGKDGKVLAFDIQEQAIHTTKKDYMKPESITLHSSKKVTNTSINSWENPNRLVLQSSI